MKFNYGKTFLLGFGFLGISIIWPIFNQFIPVFLQAGNPEFERQLLAEGRELPNVIGFGLAPSLALFIMTWDNIMNMFIAPWIGARSDYTWNRFGRRKPYILLGAPIALLAFVLVPVAQSVLAIAAFIFITNLGMALFRSPTVAWLGDLFSAEDRSKANGIINLMGGVGALLAYFGGGILFNQLGRAAPFIGGAIVTAIALIIALVFVKESSTGPLSENEQQGNILSNVKILFSAGDRSTLLVLVGILLWFMGFSAFDAGLSSFAVFTLGIKAGSASIYAGTMTIFFLLFAVPAGFLGTHWGRERTIRIGLIGLALSALIGFFLVKNAITLVVTLLFAGAFWAMVNVNSLPLVYDHGDEQQIGAYTGLYYFSSQLASVLGPTLLGIMVDALGNQYRWLWLFAAVFMIIAFAVILGVKRQEHSMAESIVS
jgi:maltose/moltooligosaccharide transporter